jgi:hypothetical protein
LFSESTFLVIENILSLPFNQLKGRMATRRKQKRKSVKKPLKITEAGDWPMVDEKPEPKEKNWWLPYILLFVIPFILYGSSITFEYVLDDKIVLSENSFVKKGVSGISEIFTTESFTGFLGSQKDLVVGARYRPLSIAMFAVEYEFFGLNPKVNHFINILLYALTGLLFYRVLKNLWSKDSSGWFIAVPFMAALLFVLHPVHTEVVANIKSRDEILSLFLCLVSLHLSYKFTQNNRKSYLLLCGLIFLLALLAKENAITFLAVIPLTLYVFQKLSVKRLINLCLPLLFATALFVYIRYEVVGYVLDSGTQVTGLMNDPFLGATLADKYATIVYTLGYYLRLLIFPHPLTHDYYPYQIPIMNWGDWQVLLSLALYLFAIGFAFVKLKKRSVTAWGILTFLATLSIVSNLFFPIGTFMNERFLYMPSIAFVVVLAYWTLEKLPLQFQKYKLSKNIAFGILILLLAGYSYKTLERVPAWESPLSLNTAASKVSVNSARANQFMAYSLYVEANATPDRVQKQKLLEEATLFVDKALGIYPGYPDANNCKAGVAAGLYQLNGDLDALLKAFYEVQLRLPSPFVDTYLEYLQGRGDINKLNSFYQKLGTDLIINGNRPKGEFYLRKIRQ